MSIQAVTWKKQKENVDIFNTCNNDAKFGLRWKVKLLYAHLYSGQFGTFPLRTSDSLSDLANLYSVSYVFEICCDLIYIAI